MDYYRRYVGDYLKKTLDLSLAEDGVYTRMLDHYYAKESAFPNDFDAICRVIRVQKSIEKRFVKSVLEKHFRLEDDGLYHNARADKELGIAVQKIEKMREVARENGKKGGRPKKPRQVVDNNQVGFAEKTHSGSETEPGLVSTRASQPTVNRQPPTKTCLSDHRFPGDSDITEPAPKAVGSAPQDHNPHPATLARILAECARAALDNPTADNAMIQRWVDHGATPTLVLNALIEARRSVHPPRPLTAAYVDPIIERLIAQDRDTRHAAEARVEQTRQLLAEQRAALAAAAPMPDAYKPRRPSQEEPFPAAQHQRDGPEWKS